MQTFYKDFKMNQEKKLNDITLGKYLTQFDVEHKDLKKISESFSNVIDTLMELIQSTEYLNNATLVLLLQNALNQVIFCYGGVSHTLCYAPAENKKEETSSVEKEELSEELKESK